MPQNDKQEVSLRDKKRYRYLLQHFADLNDRDYQEFVALQQRLMQESSTSPIGRRSQNRSSQPRTPSKRPIAPKKTSSKSPHRRLKTAVKFGCLGTFLVVLAMIAFFLKGMTGVKIGQTEFRPAVTEYFAGQKTRDGVNILILGSDKRVTEASTEARTDTVMVMNVGNSSGKVKLVSFMRDTLVTIDGYSYPENYDLKLNTAFTLGEQDNNQGAELMRQTLKANFDIDIEYYAMIDFETFALAVDTLFPNGVHMDAQFSTIEGEVVDSVEVPDDLGENLSTGLYQTIAVGPQQMNGKTLLNYARFRGDDEGDNGRTRRQQEVIQAIVSQIKDPTKLFTGSEAIGKVYALTSTNISFPFVLSNGLSGLTAAQQGMERLTIPEQGDWIDGYDMYGGQGLLIDFEAYQNRLTELGLR